jgi:hypothetical protein
VTYRYNRLAIEFCHAANDGGVVGKRPIAVHFNEIREHGLYVVERIRTVCVARNLDFLPWRQLRVDFGQQLIRFFLELQDLFFEVDPPLDVNSVDLVFFQFGNRFSNSRYSCTNALLVRSLSRNRYAALDDAAAVYIRDGVLSDISALLSRFCCREHKVARLVDSNNPLIGRCQRLYCCQ